MLGALSNIIGAPSNFNEWAILPLRKNLKKALLLLLPEDHFLLLLFFFLCASSSPQDQRARLLLLREPRVLPSRQVSLTCHCFYYAVQLQHLGQDSGTSGQMTPEKMGKGVVTVASSERTVKGSFGTSRSRYFEIFPEEGFLRK